jgi:hypothetical protein
MKRSVQKRVADGSLASVVGHVARDAVSTLLQVGALALATAAVRVALPAYTVRPRRD